MIRFILLSLILVWQTVSWASIQVHIEPQHVQLGEMFRLSLTMPGAHQNDAPDLTPLKKDFRLMGVEQNQSYTLINGQAESFNEWHILLIPTKSGHVILPALTVGGEETKPMTIEVSEDASTTPANHATPSTDDVMLTTDVNEPKPYVNQQIIYTVKLYNSRHLLDAEFIPPTVKDALLIALGQGRQYQTTLHGEVYSVEEQQFAIFPQKSGALRSSPPRFNAIVYDGVQRRVHLQGKPLNVTVQPMPVLNAGEAWLPAKKINLTEVYDKADTSLSKGTALVRTVTLQAEAVPAQLLPTLVFKGHDQFGIYPEKPTIDNTVNQQAIIGTSTVKVTYLLNKAGAVTIPPIALPWFNTVTGKTEIAHLPARELMVSGGSTPVATIQAPTTPLSNKVMPPARVATKEGSYAIDWMQDSLFITISVGIVLLFIVGWRYHSSSLYQKKRLARRRLRQACLTNQAHEARHALLAWAILEWPQARLFNLADLANWVSEPALKKALDDLSAALFGFNSIIPWEGASLWHVLNKKRGLLTASKPKKIALPSINP